VASTALTHSPPPRPWARELRIADPRTARIVARLVPLLGFLFAALLIMSRRPDAVTEAQFWAEDGRMYYANVYNHGLLATLAVPQSGYFQELPVLAVGVAQLVPLGLAPLLTNLLAIAIRALPVGLLLSSRARTISPDLRVRALLAGLYVALPGIPDTDANIDNALWYLAVAALIVLMLAPATRRRTRLCDAAILSMCAVTGVFTIVLAPLAFLYRHWRGPRAVPTSTRVILTLGAALQLTALLVLQYHLPAGFNVGPRITVPLHATTQLFFQILGGQVVLPALVGNSTTVVAGVAVLAGIGGALGALLALRHASDELRLLLAFACAVLVMALAHPQGVDWPTLSSSSGVGRYFLIPELAVVATVVWAAGRTRPKLLRSVVLALLLFVCTVVATTQWSYTAFMPSEFPKLAERFERAPVGTRMVFPIEPMPWSMTLVKH
jgi:hypothetical protein